MAERFTKFDGGGIQYAGGPNIDFANLRESEKASQSMTATADRLSSYFMKIATEQAAVEGAAYYAENPLTLEQLEQAKALGQDPEDLFAGNFTAFDKAGRKVQLQQISAEIEMTARTELTSMLADVKLGKADLSTLTDMSSGSPRPGGKLADLVDGLSSTIKDAAPELYPTVRANLSQLANSTLSSAIGEMATRTEKERKLRAEKGVSDIISAIPGIIARGPIIDQSNGQTITVEQQLSVAKSSLDNLAAYANDPTMLKQARASYDAAITKARQAALEDWADMMPGGPGAALSQIRSGKFESPAMAAAYKALPQDKQLEVRESVRTLRSNRRADLDAVKSDQKKARDESDANLVDDWLQARSISDTQGMLDAIVAMSSEIRGQYQAIMRTDPTGYKGGDGISRSSIQKKIEISGSRVTSTSLIQEVDIALKLGKITNPESDALYAAIKERQSKKMVTARARIQGSIQYNPDADTSKLEAGEVQRRKAIYSNAMTRLYAAYDADPLLNIEDWIVKNMKVIERTETQREFIKANKSLNSKLDFLKKKGITSTSTSDDIVEMIGTKGLLNSSETTIATQVLQLMATIKIIEENLERPQ